MNKVIKITIKGRSRRNNPRPRGLLIIRSNMNAHQVDEVRTKLKTDLEKKQDGLFLLMMPLDSEVQYISF